MLEPGKKLGHYEIGESIGAGGMGEVFRARDTKLNRDVALKVLPDSVADDPDRLARFQREAEVLASLNHPNIAAIYGLEGEAENRALVLELVEGPTLADRIARGSIPLDEAIAIARQIADALEAAHEAGIIHRDLKPANIKVREDGTVKVLDFGLAKALEDPVTAGVDSELSQSPTLTRATQVGMILGTAAYMSPEQAKGKRVDKRTDVWAFGAVVYEMLTGKRAFEGDDVSDTLAAVLRAEPDFDRLPSDTPAALRRVLQLCLTKDAKARVHDIADVRLAMEGAFETASTSESVARSHGYLPWVAAVVVGLVSGLAVWSVMRPAPGEVTRFAYDMPTDHLIRDSGRAALAISPDGRRFVYNTMDGLFVRSMDELDARLLPGTQAAVAPFFSPDGQSIGYRQNDQLMRIAVSGGAPLALCSIDGLHSASWTAGNGIFFANPGGILRVSANGGTPEMIVPAADGEALDVPQLLPDGDTLMFSAAADGALNAGSWDRGHIGSVSLTSGERTVLMDGGSDARYVSSGHLVYAFERSLYAVAFDPARLRATGGPVSMVDGVFRSNYAASANYAVTEEGSLFFLVAPASGAPLSWVDRSGRAEIVQTIPPNRYLWPRLSPDGDRLLVVADGDARVYDLASGRETRLTTHGATGYLDWHPTGAEFAYSSTGPQIWIQPANGSGAARQITALDGVFHFDAWAPDGRTFSGHLHPAKGPTSQWMVAYDGENAEPEVWLEHEHDDNNAVFSPDGRYAAHLSDQTGRVELYIRPFPGPGGQTPVSIGGAREPVWAATRELFYRRPDDYMMMGVEVSTDPVLTVGPPVELFVGTSPGGGSLSSRFDVTADGQRFLMSAVLLASDEAGDALRRKVVIVQNWVEELKERVPN